PRAQPRVAGGCVAATGNRGQVIDLVEQAGTFQRLKHAQVERRGAYAAAGESEPDRIVRGWGLVRRLAPPRNPLQLGPLHGLEGGGIAARGNRVVHAQEPARRMSGSDGWPRGLTAGTPAA